MAVPAELLLSALADCDCGFEERAGGRLTCEPGPADDVPLTSEPSLAMLPPLTSEPPLATEPALTSEPPLTTEALTSEPSAMADPES